MAPKLPTLKNLAEFVYEADVQSAMHKLPNIPNKSFLGYPKWIRKEDLKQMFITWCAYYSHRAEEFQKKCLKQEALDAMDKWALIRQIGNITDEELEEELK